MDLEKVGKFIASLRKERGLSQEELSESLGVSRTTESRWECGLRAPDISMLVPISEYFNISVLELINGKRDTSIPEENKATKELVDYSIKKKKKKYNKVIFILVIIFLIFIVSLSSYYMGYKNNSYVTYKISENKDDFSVLGDIISNDKDTYIFIRSISYNNLYVGTDKEIFINKLDINIISGGNNLISLNYSFDEDISLSEALDDISIYFDTEEVGSIDIHNIILEIIYTNDVTDSTYIDMSV